MRPDRHGTELPFALPDVGIEETSAVASVLEGGWLTTGAVAERFERELADAVRAEHAVALSSCTAALHLALASLDPEPGSAVVTSPYNFTAAAEVAQHLDLVPVFSDIEPRHLNLDPVALEKTLSELGDADFKVAAVIPMHLGGHPCDLEAIDTVAARHRSAVIEDAAHALPSSYRGLPIGARRASGAPHATCFSFYATKTLTTGEGGMLVTDDEEVARRCRCLSLHGMSRSAWDRDAKAEPDLSDLYDVERAGYKYNLSDLAAAVGLAQLGKLGRTTARRVEIARSYTAAFEELDDLEPPRVADDVATSWHLYVLRLRLSRFSNPHTARDRLAADLRRRGVATSLHYRPLHLHSHFKKRYGLAPGDFPVALEASRRALSLPIYSRMDDRDVARVVAAVRAALGEI